MMAMYDNALVNGSLTEGLPALLAGSIPSGGRRPTSGEPASVRVTPVTIDCGEPQHSPGSESRAAAWVTQRKCADTDPNVFFPSDGAGVIAAQRICRECPVSEPCREYALANNITHGVWGGTSERQRRRILRDRRRAGNASNAA